MRRSAACTAILLIVLVCASFATPSALPVSAPLAAAAPAPTAAESDEPPVTAPQNSATPQAVRYTQITLGDGHYCALTHTGAVYCWGSNSHGQLGDGTRTDTATPIQVHGLSSGVVSISAGLWHTCALMNTGEVMCWGWNSYGQLGDNSTTDRWTPVPVSGLSNATAIEAGGWHTCAVTAAGNAYCWGRNNDQGSSVTTRQLHDVLQYRSET
ncbi:MAG: hypothetical protein RMJ48_01685 [Roseiflexaceae bacterium]|nr:hypothetical protein [Roseiflexaceae bacterium]